MQANEGRIRVFGPEPESHRVPAEVLAQAIHGLQEAAWVVAAAHEGIQLSVRFRPSSDLRQKYTVEVGPPEAGSVAVGFAVVDRRAQPALDVEGAARDVVSKLHDAIRYVSEEAYGSLQTILPDSRWRRRLFRELQAFLPKPGDSWHFAIATSDRAEVTVAGKATSQLSEAVGATVESTSVMAVIGTLVRVDFESNQLWIKHPRTNKEIECNYLPEIEEELIEARRDYVQVIGEFTLDDAGLPRRLSNVSSVNALNLAPITIENTLLAGAALQFRPPLILSPHLDEESMQLLEVDDAELNLHAFGYTRDELMDEIEACVAYLWSTFASGDSSTMSQDALDLRDRLRSRITEVENA